MLDERSVLPEFRDQLITLDGKRERECSKVVGKYKIQDTKRFITASDAVMKLNPNYYINIPVVDAWRKNTKTGKYKLRDQDIANLINYGEKAGYYQLFSGATRQYCFSRVALACIWPDFVEHFDDIITNALKKHINPNNIAKPQTVVLSDQPTPKIIPEIYVFNDQSGTDESTDQTNSFPNIFEPNFDEIESNFTWTI